MFLIEMKVIEMKEKGNREKKRESEDQARPQGQEKNPKTREKSKSNPHTYEEEEEEEVQYERTPRDAHRLPRWATSLVLRLSRASSSSRSPGGDDGDSEKSQEGV